MTAHTLKPCPFCGGNPKLWVGLSEFKDGEIHCECGCTSGNHPSAEAATAAWNTRPETDRLIAEAVAAERERCAEMFDEMALNETARSSQFRGGSDPWFNHTQLAKTYSAAAAAIRGQS